MAFWVGGKFQKPSGAYGDVAIVANKQAGSSVTGPELANHPLMVRVRKNANTMAAPERDRFLSAFAALNGAGQGIFSQFRDTHVDGRADEQAHGGSDGGIGFLPWHRAFMLDLERELQAIDATVTLPYWRFDKAAPKLITRQFLGVPTANGTVAFSLGHPLNNWSTDGQVGVFRGPGVTPNNIPQPDIPGFVVLTEAQTLALSQGSAARFAKFARMQGTPHGAAHMANWSGPITSIPTATRDPLFFLLHCNIDRLWAKWQWLNKRNDPAKSASYGGPAAMKGHNLDDTLWPWDGDTVDPRPSFVPPRTALAASTMVAAPGPTPRLRDMLDYYAIHGGTELGFGYDDVPFEN